MKALLNLLLKRAKAPVIRELKRAISKLRSGATASEVIPQLLGFLTRTLSGYLPKEVGTLLLGLVLAGVNWNELARQPSDVVADKLTDLLIQVEGARI